MGKLRELTGGIWVREIGPCSQGVLILQYYRVRLNRAVDEGFLELGSREKILLGSCAWYSLGYCGAEKGRRRVQGLFAGAPQAIIL